MKCLCKGCGSNTYDITYNPIARMKLPVAKRQMLGYFCAKCIEVECDHECKRQGKLIPEQRTA